VSLQPGQSLSHYRLIEKIGEGGMGVVWKALDTTLDREVAIKVLPEDFSRVPGRLKRFQREAKAVAALNHPNIVTVHSVERTERLHLITMELVEGKILTELIPGTGLPLERFFELAVPLADAISAAHRHGITHRDLKPENVMVDADGRLKVLDFGLAKIGEEARAAATGSQLETRSGSITEHGMILGTVAYMSPEQAQGKPIDHRSDIFSLGVMFYQMATGKHPFLGETGMLILSSIIKDTPVSITELNHSLPRHLGRIVNRCLAKEPALRYQAALDLRNDLTGLQEEIDSGISLPSEETPQAPRRGLGRRWVFGAGLAVAALIVGYFWLEQRLNGPESRRTPLTATIVKVTSQPGQELFSSLSPDGKMLVYSSKAGGNWDVYLQRVGGEIPNNLTEDFAGYDGQPAFSPDGEYIAFRSGRQGGGIFVMGATGESVRRLSDSGFNPAWSADGSEIVFSGESIFDPWDRAGTGGLWAVDVAGGGKRVITETDAVQPSASPNGHRIAYWGNHRGAQRDIWTIPSQGGDAVLVTDDAPLDWNPIWSPDGAQLYFSSDRGGSMNLWRVPIEEKSGRVEGPPEQVTTGGAASHQHLSVSADGRRIAYVESLNAANIHKVAFDPATGSVEGQPIPVTRGSTLTRSPSPSPDGEWIVFKTMGKQEDLFVVRADGTARRQITNDVHMDREPKWSPDGKRIAFFSDRDGSAGSWTIKPDGTDLKRVTDGVLPIWSPDGSRIVTTAGIVDLRLPPEERSLEVLPPLNESGEVMWVTSWSPDGRMLAGPGSKGSGIYLFSLETREYRRLLDFGGGAKWLGDNRHLVFGHRGRLHFLDTESGAYHEILSLDPVASIQGWFSLSRDDRTIYFGRSTDESDIWMLTLE
jgi:serine/threonine protein kinase